MTKNEILDEVIAVLDKKSGPSDSLPMGEWGLAYWSLAVNKCIELVEDLKE